MPIPTVSLITVLFLCGTWAVGSAQARTPLVDAGVSPEKIDVSLHEPVSTALTIRNGLAQPVTVDLGDDRKRNIVVTTIFPDGRKKRSAIPVHQGLARIGRITLPPAGSYSQTLVL